MRKLVGKRENVNPGLKEAMGLVATLTPAGPKPSAIEFNETCAKCKEPVKITLSEDINTGEIWFEAPDNCGKCGHQLSDNKAAPSPLSQEAISNFFGKY